MLDGEAAVSDGVTGRALVPLASGPCVVIGGGLVGSACALALARAGEQVVVLEEQTTTRAPSAGDVRPIALAAASRRILDHLDVWPHLAESCQPIQAVHVSRRGHWPRVCMRANDYHLPALGYVSDAGSIAHALDRAVANEQRISRREAITVTRIAGDAHGVVVHTDATGSVANAALVVLASGAGVLPGERSEPGGRHHDYRQDALVCNVEVSAEHGGVAYERFLATGPLALLPLADGRCGLVWTLPRERARELAASSDDAFLAELQEAFGHRLGRIRGASPRACFPLELATRRACTQPRTVRIGNAAHQLHPVAGQGLNLGLRDVATLAELVEDARAAGNDVGDASLIARYHARRRNDQRMTVLFTHVLAKGFAGTRSPIAGLGSMAMLLMQLVPGARALLARRAMGLAPPVPRAARGGW